MPQNSLPLIFDGHNDVLLRQYSDPDARRGFSAGFQAHLDVPRARQSGFAGGFFAIFVPGTFNLDSESSQMRKASYDQPLPPPVSQKDALPVAMAQAAKLIDLENDGAVKICTSVDDINDCMKSGTMAAIMHMEGAEAIDENFEALEVFHRAGLRSLGPVWSRPTIFGHGVPFRFPSDGDTGPGLTETGQELVKQCNSLGILLDLSHMNAAGFWDVARLSDAPLVATHSNVHAICPHARNLTDRQLAAIKDSDGMVGLNFAVAFLREDGQKNPDTSLDIMMRHLDYLISHVGEDRVGLGSDFDGAMIPDAIGDVTGLVPLRQAMENAGIGPDLMTKICHGNWLALLERTWK